MYVVGQGFFLPPVKVGDVLDLEIVGIGKSGDGVAEVEGFKIFVPGTEVGDRLRVKIKSIRSGHAIGAPAD
ncbi:MAG TPA: TRAM domain-containing protein [Methanothrix sp.]|nr:TRAM domain-containing protein [Methanothrix sp.]HPJ84726.1 TRAM domain-containing protein [Methanothrix sp.]HPR66732.1 TRAM domain-containing protein [Methanothrix sp.]